MINLELNYDPKLREKFQSGFLPKEWKEKYNWIFDDDDLRIALSQPNYHFSEWFVAVYFVEKGYNVLVEQYIYKAHPRKIAILDKYFTQDQVKLLHNREVQPPDLFIYKEKDFFFAEVKRDKDRLASKQNEFFRRISNEFRCEVLLVNLRRNV